MGSKNLTEEKGAQGLVQAPDQRSCRFCHSRLNTPFLDLGTSPLANSYVRPGQIDQPEPFYPLRVYVCDQCLLVQLEELESPEHIFSDYAYFSSYSDSWLRHAKNYAEMAIERFELDSSSQVIEIASNDGYLLQYFAERGVPVLGIEPAANVAQAAIQKGIPTSIRFFGADAARELVSAGTTASLLIGNNVLAHVPGLNDFVEGLRILLNPHGVITLEFPHVMRLVEENQFDTIYHEHFSYFSLTTVERVFCTHGLRLFDVGELPTHGGSLRVYLCHAGDLSRQTSPRVADVKAREDAGGFTRTERYARFAHQVEDTKRRLLNFLGDIKRQGKTVAAYGAPAKGNTLLNYCGVRADVIDYTVDRNPEKQGCLLPGTRIPIHHPDRIMQTKPDYLLILPWNLKDEIMDQMSGIRAWGGRFVVPIPETSVYS